MYVKFLDLHAGYLELQQDIDVAVKNVIRSGQYVLGPVVESFEGVFAEYCQANCAIGVANGLDALILSLRALNIGEGDEVIVPSNTFIATWLAVSAVKAVPVPVEPDPKTYNMDSKKIASAISPLTRAIIVVHLYGQPADLEPILEIARRNNIAIIEDAAQCVGARYRGKRIGSHSDAVCWSFYPGKNLGAMGDGGAVTTNNVNLAAKVRALGNYGSDTKYVHKIQGMNSRLDPIQAAILKVKLNHLDNWTSRRCTIAELYLDALSNVEGIVLPCVLDHVTPVWHLFVIRSERRDALQAHLAACGVETLIHYPIPPHRQRAYQTDPNFQFSLPIADKLSSEVLSLPIWPQMKEDDVLTVVDAIAAFN